MNATSSRAVLNVRGAKNLILFCSDSEASRAPVDRAKKAPSFDFGPQVGRAMPAKSLWSPTSSFQLVASLSKIEILIESKVAA
jgi:hypothetical protein